MSNQWQNGGTLMEETGSERASTEEKTIERLYDDGKNIVCNRFGRHAAE